MECLCALVPLVLLVAPFIPWARPSIWMTMQEFLPMVKNNKYGETTDRIAREVVVKMINIGKCDPNDTQGTYLLARTTSWLTIAFLFYVAAMIAFGCVLTVIMATTS